MERLTAESGRGHRERGFQQPAVPQAESPTVALDLMGMDRQHLVQRQEGNHVGGERRRGSLGETAERACVLSIEVVHDLAQAGRALLRADR